MHLICILNVPDSVTVPPYAFVSNDFYHSKFVPFCKKSLLNITKSRLRTFMLKIQESSKLQVCDKDIEQGIANKNAHHPNAYFYSFRLLLDLCSSLDMVSKCFISDKFSLLSTNGILL